ncbi:putative saf4/Yju2 protein [Helianthus annuus]|nr:putative saf4/Yju2 protein [Helianthus annuus]KAJ0602352.1 putative saf4/Yju2 protein [Helianthus annuus]KAJ0609234.1 putative saf4/Yju2 protein [Helianthus annuus]KAJ0937141.1 putative saf4/Yju2 protein [Helianthus annuus]KAJ0945081.1 putative CWC16 protein [Helianthus annuus]
MSERKVVNKYYPPDFDPAKIPRRSQQQQQINVRYMLPMSIRCGTCGSYIYKGTKFNSRQEKLIGETYLGIIPIFRFYIKCPHCCAEIAIKTDPQQSDYLVEAGARRNFEPHAAAAAQDEVGDAMETSKRQTEILSALDELKSMKSRRAHLSVDSMLEALQPLPLEEEEDKQQLDIFQRSRRCRQHAHVTVDDSMQQPYVFQRSPHELHKKRKPTYYHLTTVPKKKSPKTQEIKSNGLALLCQQYDKEA